MRFGDNSSSTLEFLFGRVVGQFLSYVFWVMNYFVNVLCWLGTTHAPLEVWPFPCTSMVFKSKGFRQSYFTADTWPDCYGFRWNAADLGFTVLCTNAYTIHVLYLKVFNESKRFLKRKYQISWIISWQSSANSPDRQWISAVVFYWTTLYCNCYETLSQ